MWVADVTRPEIMIAVRKVDRQAHSPLLWNWKAAPKILEYLNGTSHSGVRSSSRGKGNVATYAEATYANFKTDARSVSGSVFMSTGGAVSWLSST